MTRTRTLVFSAAASIVVVVAAYLFEYRNADTPSDDVYVGKAIYSPDHRHIAVRYTMAGGGMGASYCFNYVSIAPVSVAPAAAYARRYRIYSGNCHSLGFVRLPSGAMLGQDGPQLAWAAPNRLHLTYNPRIAALGVNVFLLAAHSEDGAVAVVPHKYPH